MSSETITCPSGMLITVRGLKTKEADVLASSSGSKAIPATLQTILSACCESIDDHGPYKSPLSWDDVLQGDRTFVLLQIRKATLGSEYEFKTQCPSAGCRHRFDWLINLDDMPVRPLKDSSREKFKAGNRFEGALSDGTKFVYRLPTGADEKRSLKLKSQHKSSLLSLSLRMRIVEVDGVDPQGMRKFIEEMELRDSNALLEQFDENDCGVETSIEIECPECYHLYDVNLPFDPAFFFPSQQSNRKRRAAQLEAV